MDEEKQYLEHQLTLYVKEHIRLVNLIIKVGEALQQKNYGIAEDLLRSEISYEQANEEKSFHINFPWNE